MANPFLIGGLAIGGAWAAWRLVRERGRIRRMIQKLAKETAVSESAEIVRLERDPDTGVFTPHEER